MLPETIHSRKPPRAWHNVECEEAHVVFTESPALADLTVWRRAVQHRSGCKSCQVYLSEYRRLAPRLRRLADQPAPSILVRLILLRIRGQAESPDRVKATPPRSTLRPF